MSGTALTLDFSGGGPMLAHLARLAARQEWTKARREIGEFMVGDIEDNLDGQKLFDGSPMAPSKAAQGRTTHWKRGNKKIGRVRGSVRAAGKTLIDKHNLYDSYVYQLARGGLEVGSASVYAAIHHFGGETGAHGHRFHMTARPVMGIATRQELQLGYLLGDAIRALEPGGAQ